MSKPVHLQSGFTYIVVMVLLAVVMLAATLTVEVVQIASRRAAEAELRSIGHEFEKAFERFHAQTPVGARPYPQRLDDLVLDPRAAGIRRHLRRIYRDPLTGQGWGLIEAPGGGIMGVYSLSLDKPLGLRPEGPLVIISGGGEGPSGYAAWRFGYAPPAQGRAHRPVKLNSK